MSIGSLSHSPTETLEPLVLTVPPVRESAHLAMLLAAQTAVSCRLALDRSDASTRSTLFAISSMGAEVFRDGTDLLFAPVPSLRPSLGPLHSGPSPTTLALVLAQAATMKRTVEVRASKDVSAAQVAPLVAALQKLGASIHRVGPPGATRFRVQGPIEAGAVFLGDDATADHVMALLAALSAIEGTSTVTTRRGVRHPWQQQMARDFGLAWLPTEVDNTVVWAVSGVQKPERALYCLPGDWSVGVPLMVGALLMGRPLEVHGLRDDASAAPVLRAFSAFGAHIRFEDDALRLDPREIRAAGTLDLRGTPELVAPLAVLAAFARGRSTLRTGPHPHIPVLVRALKRVGALVDPTGTHLSVRPGPHMTGRVGLRSEGHPGLARALRLLGLRLPAVMVESTSVDPPGYDRLMATLRGWTGVGFGAAR